MRKHGEHGSAPQRPEVIETHMSWVFLTEDRAFKLLKPVVMPFLDLTSSEVRRAVTRRELELNRRITPDVYLGLADVHEHGQLVDHMVVMARLPADRRLSALIGTPGFEGCVQAVARRMAVFHSAEKPILDAPMARRDAVQANWDDNVAVIAAHPEVIGHAESERVEELARRYLDGREHLFDQRIAEGYVRDGHGDLIADDIFCLDDGPRIIDCLAFSDEWRIGDVLLDVGFLAMDLHRLAGLDSARFLLDRYREFSGSSHPESLAHHYMAYRAGVRAKVACLRREQGHAPSADLARTYHRLALDHLEAGRIRVILVGGGPGVGKSTLAQALGAHFGYPVLVTDEIRKDLTATPKSEHRFAAPGEGIYDMATTTAAYEEMLREAEVLVDAGHGVVLDASWSADTWRDAARSMANRTSAEVSEIECTLDPSLAKERIARRMASVWNPSDATPDLVDHLVSSRDPWPSATSVSMAPGPDAVASTVIERLG